jgi:peptidoglycan/xylan/chitin deacetylase (PgdA/CDA1 family)
MTWEQIAELHRDGFEIGNHTRDHMGVSAQTLGRLREQVERSTRVAPNMQSRGRSARLPGNAIHTNALPVLKELGFRFARRGAHLNMPTSGDAASPTNQARIILC